MIGTLIGTLFFKCFFNATRDLTSVFNDLFNSKTRNIMKNQDTFSVTIFPIFGKEIKGKTPLYLRITVNGKRTKLSLKRNFTTSLWDPKISRLKGSSAEARQINAYLDQVLIQIYEAYRELLREKKIITPQAIKSRYRGEDDQNKTLLQLTAYHNFNMKSVLKP